MSWVISSEINTSTDSGVRWRQQVPHFLKPIVPAQVMERDFLESISPPPLHVKAQSADLLVVAIPSVQSSIPT